MTLPPLLQAHIYIIRHGQTAANAVRYVGREDEPLDDSGRGQAEALVAALAKHSVDALFTSPLARAQDTAAPLARARGIVVQVRPELIELDFGDRGGALKEASQLRVRRDHLHQPVPGGESLADVAVRIAGFIARDLRPALQPGRSVAIVSHFWPCRMLLGTLLGRSLGDMFTGVAYKPATGSALAVTCDVEKTSIRLTDWRPIEPCHVQRAARS